MSRFELAIPPGLVSNDTSLSAKGRWRDGSNVRFFYGKPRAIGGWESIDTTLLTGVCRTVFNWTDNGGVLNIAFGTHSALQVYAGSAIYDITPTLALAQQTLANPFTVTDGSDVVTVHHPAHSMTTGGTVVIEGADNVGRVVMNGTWTVTVIDLNTYTFEAASSADLAVTLGGNPLNQTPSSMTVVATETAHLLSLGTTVTISGADSFGTLDPNATAVITAVTTDTYSYDVTSAANNPGPMGGFGVVSTVPSTGGGSAVLATPQDAFAPGNIDGAGQSGYGTGPYGVSGYASPSDSDYVPRTWSLAAWGENLLASPRAGGIYRWENDTTEVAKAVQAAPTRVSYMLVSPQDEVFALGCNQEADGVYNPLTIRHSSIRDLSRWDTAVDSTAREYTLPGGGRIVAGRALGAYLLIWTTHNVYLGTYVGQIDEVWRFDRVGDKCGLIGPNAAVVVGTDAYWLGHDLQFYSYSLGGSVTPLVCQISEDLKENLSLAQSDKIVASSNGAFGEIRFDYPDGRDGHENSRYVAAAISGANIGAWYRGQMIRTAMVDAGPSNWPIGVTYAGNIFWHERGQTADGGAISWFIESADQMMNDQTAMLMRSLWPDFEEQVGAVNLTLTTRFKPRGDEVVKGPYTIAPGTAKVDLRANGRMVRAKFSGNAGPTAWMLGKPIFDVAATGNR